MSPLLVSHPLASSLSLTAGLALCFAAPLSTSAATAASASTCQRDSPAHAVALVELYTSEGCSSCPPADRWLAGLVARYGPERLVPLALHVDYWDDLGWSDPYAQPAFAERQRRLVRLASRSATPTIYTPEIFVAGRELRRWRDDADFAQRLQAVNRQPASAAIRLDVHGADAASVEVAATFSLPPGASGGSRQGVLVVYEDGLESAVRRGENRGATLRHERVVRYWSPPLPLAAGTAPTLRHRVQLAAGRPVSQLGLAAFVEDVHSGEVLQAVSLPLRDCLAAANSSQVPTQMPSPSGSQIPPPTSPQERRKP